MTIRNKPKRRTTITPEMLEILAKGIKRRRHKVAVVRAMLGITVHEPGTGAPIARLNPVPGTDKFTVRWWSGFRRRWMPAEALGDIVLTLEEAGPSISANDEFWIELEGSAACRHPLGCSRPTYFTHIFPCRINGLPALLEVVPCCAEPFEGLHFE